MSPLARVVWYAAFTRRQALKPSFRRSSIKMTRRQLQGCAGFLLVTSVDRSVGGLLEAGSIYQRALLRATDLGVAHHTMSYALEEDPWREQIGSALQIERPIQFILRVGRARRLARPSIRRPTAGVLENGMAQSAASKRHRTMSAKPPQKRLLHHPGSRRAAGEAADGAVRMRPSLRYPVRRTLP